MSKNILLSYPRSGNHLTRFFIELLSEIPTFGCKGNNQDVEIYKNEFSEKIPFNIPKQFDKKQSYYKYHHPPPLNITAKKVILIVRNPQEVLLRHNNYRFNVQGAWDSYETYFKNIDYFNRHRGKKLLLYYEDIITHKLEFINTLYDFLEIDNDQKRDYVVANIDKLYTLSSNGKKRSWGGIQSHNNTDFYYKKIPDSIKPKFDNYLNHKLEQYPFLTIKYNIPINIKNIKILYLHVGKTCGSSIKHILGNKITTTCHLQKPSEKQLQDADIILISIRDPIERFVSAFNYAHKIINYDTSHMDINSDFSNTIAPFHIKTKVMKGFAYNKEYNDLVNYFKTPNTLAESLTDSHNKEKAHNLMTNHTEHIYKSLGYYTNNGKIIEQYHHKIVVVSKETFNDDIKRVYHNVFQKELCDNHIIQKRQNDDSQKTCMSQVAIQNARNFYKATDYKTLQVMARYNLISRKLYNQYTNRNIIISFCSYDYVDLAEIWVAELSKINITNYVIVSTDQRTHTHLASKNINTTLVKFNNKESFWLYRIKTLQTFLKTDQYDYIIHSDLDAIWKKNIVDTLCTAKTDLYFSQGTTFPKKHLARHKFVLCCGVFCVKCNDKTKTFFNNYIKNLVKINDDQVAINLELIHTKWNHDETPRTIPNKSYVYFDNDIHGYNEHHDLNVSLISFGKIQREYMDDTGDIYHILSPKQCSQKINTFRKLNII